MRAVFADISGEPDLIDEIYKVSLVQPELTPRSKEKLEELARNLNLALVYQNEQLVGWALIEPVGKNLVEVGMLFIKPEARSAAAFADLMSLIAKRREKVIIASYDQKLIRYLVRSWKAKQISLLQVIWLTRGRFILKRLDRNSRTAISRKVKSRKPLYALVGER